MAKLSPLTFRIAKLWGSDLGTVEKHHIDAAITYIDPSLDFTTNLIAELMLIKMKDEISVLMNDASISIKLECQRCLKSFVSTIEIPSAERQFLHDDPAEDADLTDIYQVDRKMMTIDLNEMIRQEIILHFPFIPVCSEGCRGLCPHCKKDRNEEKCECKEEDTETFKPFSDLKKILEQK